MKTWICQHCNIECEYNEPHIRKRHILNHNYYYSYRFKCPQCLRWYFPPEAIIYYKDVEKNVIPPPASLVDALKAVYQENLDRSPKKQQQRIIHAFRQYYLDNPNAYYNRQEKLDALIYLSTVKYESKLPLAEQRALFDEKKYHPIWKLHIETEKCFICFKKSEIRHHIILLKNGGRNVYSNIVMLCNPCHADIHPWLKEQLIKNDNAQPKP